MKKVWLPENAVVEKYTSRIGCRTLSYVFQLIKFSLWLTRFLCCILNSNMIRKKKREEGGNEEGREGFTCMRWRMGVSLRM